MRDATVATAGEQATGFRASANQNAGAFHLDSLPKITVVTPSYNQAQFLERTINSVLDQGYPNLEYIVIDGGSTDGSQDIIRKYSSSLAYWVSRRQSTRGSSVRLGTGSPGRTPTMSIIPALLRPSPVRRRRTEMPT